MKTLSCCFSSHTSRPAFCTPGRRRQLGGRQFMEVFCYPVPMGGAFWTTDCQVLLILEELELFWSLSSSYFYFWWPIGFHNCTARVLTLGAWQPEC